MEPDARAVSPEDVRLVQEKAAVAFRLHGNARASKVGFWILLIGASVAFWFHSYWFFGFGLAASFAAYFFISNSCVRYVERTMGISAGAQLMLVERYKADPDFKQAVDRLHQGAAKFADELARKRPG